MQKILFQKKLLAWYGENKRDLPWRRTRDPYAIWVSEIMLQQTQVDTVIPYFKRWMKQFPTVQKLARAKEETVLKAWQGLGYYRRARMLQKASQEITAHLEGQLPKTANELQQLPGIGKYTAGAIASIAYEEKAPVLDGNVIRILTRIFSLKEDILLPKTIKSLWLKAEELLPNKNIGDFNQALMELGATICTPKNPSCQTCPLKTHCLAQKENTVANLPFKSNRQKIIKQKNVALVWRNNNKILIRKQIKGEKWEGLWTLPFSDSFSEFEKKFSISKSAAKKCFSVSHGYTKYKIELDAFTYSSKPSFKINEPEYQWTNIQRINHLAFPAPHQKIIEALL